MRLVCVNAWSRCNCGHAADYMKRVPDSVAKINATVTYKPVCDYGVKMFPTWLVVDDSNRVVARSTELNVDSVMKWYEGVKNA